MQDRPRGGKKAGEEPARRGVRRSPEGARKEALFRVPENRDGQSVLSAAARAGERSCPLPSRGVRGGAGGVCAS